MRIRELAIHNFRSIRHLEMCCEANAVLIGPNNGGKSNILSALEYFLSPATKAVPEDLFAFHDAGDDDLWVEVTFSELTAQEKSTFNKYVRTDGSVRVRKGTGAEGSPYRGYIQQPEPVWLRPEAVETLLDRGALGLTELVRHVPATGKLTKKQIVEAQETYLREHRGTITFVEALEGTPFMGTKNVAAGLLPDLYLVPAVRDLSDETKIKGTTMLGRLVQRAIQGMTVGDERFKDASQKLQALVSAFNSGEENGGARPAQLDELERSVEAELKGWGVRVGIELLPPALEKLFELGTNLHIDDGHRTLAERKGHGLQRAVLFALLRAWAKALRSARAAAAESSEETSPRRSSDSVIFAIEEPELFLHPHGQRRLAATIAEIGGAPEHQVFVSTHSTHFVDMTQHRSICLIGKQSAREGTTVRQCTGDLFDGPGEDDRKRRFQMASWINPDRAEMFFAKRIAFVEGETERKMFPFLAERMGCLNHDVTIVDCGAKHNLPLYIAIANGFRLSYVVVHDEDPLPDPIPAEWKEERKREKARTFALNEEIRLQIDPSLGRVVVLRSDFENAAGISKGQGVLVQWPPGRHRAARSLPGSRRSAGGAATTWECVAVTAESDGRERTGWLRAGSSAIRRACGSTRPSGRGRGGGARRRGSGR